MTEANMDMESLLTELKASLSQPTGEAVLRRINAERLLRLLADEFIEAHQAERIRVLPDSRVAGEAGADFLLQIDDYDIRLQFLDAPAGTPTLDEERLSGFLSLLEDNPSTVALVLVWTTDELLAVLLSVAQARGLLWNRDALASLLAKAKPLPEVLRALVAQQVKLWEIGLDEKSPSSVKPLDMRSAFEEAIATAIDTERQRLYRHAERKLAAQHFPAEEEEKLIFDVLAEALNGASARDMVPHLTRMPRRGKR